MSRRGGASEDAAGEQSPRERSDSTSSGAGSSGAAPSASPQFVALHSRVGKRYQAVIPELLASPADIAELLYKKQALQQPKPRYCPDKAEELGLELDKYLKLARSLRDGATFDTQEQVTTLALQHLHRFDYNTTDAACSLYARHSIELPRSTTGVNQSTAKPTAAEESKKWLLAFYRCMRCTEIDGKMLDQMCALHEKAKASGDMIPVTEAGVLLRLVTRILTWREQCEAVSKEKVDRAQLLQLLHQAEDMQLVLPEKNAVVSRLQAFDIALMQLKEALEHSSKRHQSKRVELKELLALFEAVMAPQLVFPEESSFRETVDEVKELKSTIDKMLAEDKVSLSLIRDVLAKIELVPVNFEQEVEQFQNKMHSAQTWLAKARKIMPNRRPTRRAGGADTKKMDLEAIRALVDDAPCENSTEMFEMQDLLECADVWAVKVKEAIDGGADVTLEQLKELLDEAKDIPVVMDEQKFLEAEIAAREWCTTAASKLASRTSIEEMEDLLTQAKTIRERIYPKKQSRWKPQVERDIGAAMDQSRKWINELRDNLGVAAFDKLFASLSSYVPSSHSSRSSSSATSVDRAKKKTMDAISKLIEKSQALAIDVSSYTTPLNDLLLKGVEAQAEASAILMSIGCLSGTIASNLDVSSSMDIDSMPRELGDLAQASALLEKIDSFPFTFEEGLSLASIVEGEKDWAARVRECIPPRQSRKKRLANDSFTTEQLHELLNESKRLRFLFRDELRILSKELHDLTTWRAKAHEVINGEVSASVANVVERLQSFDLMVYEKLQKAKKKLHIGDVGPTAADEESNEGTDVDMSLAPPNDESKAIKKEEESDVSAMDVDAEGPRDSVIPMELGNQADSKPEGSKDKLSSSENGVQADAVAPDTKPTNVNDVAAVNMQALEIHADSIMTHVRIESGCMQKSVAKKEEENSDDSKTSWMAKNGRDLLEPVLAMAEDSFETVNSLELKEAEARQTVEELVLAGEKGDITENITDESVRVLDGWKQQLLHVQKESDVLSVEAPEQKVIALIISLLEWLQGSRSLFYDEILPLQDLVAKGGNVMETLREIKALNVVKPATLATLERMLWPLAYLKTHEKVVLEWTERVHKCVADKHARVSELQTLLDNGSGLLLEQGAFKVVMDEAKKARVWLSKLKKRLRALITKGVGRMSMSAARSLVEEGEDIAIDMPVFDFLKEHLEIASDWENRVLASGIESGQARVANLLALLNEYECARLVIDLDMHRDVLKSATERYCICRQPFDGLMIGCDHCDDWFHDSCIGMSKEKAEKVEHYTCPSCTILQELGAMLQHTKAAEKQNNLWDMQEYARAFEKHQASALRKVKREEKTVERTEMLLFSCNNQMNQLRARIDDIERGVEQQLTKMKSEHVEASKQVLELQSSLRLSRERLANAQQALRELSDVFHARHRMLPYAQAWERPSRCEISDAIAYALEYGLWEDKKTVTPLRSLIGRVDAWVSRAHKCMTKSASKTQQLSRLKALMNEYSKLPLTYAKTAEPLDVYVKLFTGGVVKSKVKNEDEALTSEAAEAAAVKTLDEAMVGLSPSVSSTASASNTSATKKQAPLPEEPSDEAIYNDRQQLEYIDGPALSHKNDQVDVKDESELWVEGEGEASRGETEGEAAENNGEVTFEEKEEAADEVNGEIAPWGDNETNLEAGIDAEEDEDDDGDAWEWQLRVVQRVSEGMLDLSLFTSGGFDFVVVLNVQHNALRDLRPIEGMAQTLRVLNASQNEIATLPSIGFWSQFRCLSMCFLSENALKTWADVQGLEGCARSLLWLTLTNNPLMALKNARIFVVNKLPFLKALDNFVTTDQEVVQHARPSARFNALAPRLSLAHLHMPLEFETDDGALLYVGETEIAIASTYADNSPSVRTQKLIRGYLSRRANFPRFRNVRELIIHVQKHIRGFLLRQLIKRQICELVAANGESKLLMASVAAGHGLLSPLARRSFERMLPMIRRWRTHFQAKKRAVAIKKIRFWCQMVYQHPEPESMSSRFEDAAALLLVDGVQVEPTLMERELMLGITQPPIADMFAQMNPFREFPTCQRVVDSATRVMDIARRLSGNEAARNWQLESSQLGIDTSFVRLTFESIDEARKRALLLLCKTFDPITKTYARMFTLEALFGAAFRHHQWAICQGATREEIEAVLDESLVWMQDEFPSRWWIQTQQKLEALHTYHRESLRLGNLCGRPYSSLVDLLACSHNLLNPAVVQLQCHCVWWSQPFLKMLSDIQAIGSSSRHQILVNRLGKSSYSSVEDKQDQELQAREHFVRDLREEGERAAEALIVDRRMLQRQKATEVANIKLDIDVNLQRIRFERELDQIHAREALEHQRHATRRRKLTRKFETSFVAQSGALMRRAARAAVASSLKAEEQEQQRLAATVKVREAEALERRRDAKSFWFVRNRLEKREMEALRQLRSAEVDKAERSRLGGRRQRMNEDKEIKKLLHIM
ncbi:hypothetical protein JG687_00010868 [Phytophthora cactorum]|uniref:PHD-type domain-containing protein n=1 Tax=Phytophthora cactorum TaxID=29920 RepID=A0A8T1U654_9STRA|nr:hypothetical protein JG687_00010868 [Phytophthora cactorum]